MSALAHRKVLILNKMWTAVQVASLQRAMRLLANDEATDEPKARIIDAETFQPYTWEDWAKMRPADGEDAIQGYSNRYRIPELILLSDYDKTPYHRVRFSRRTIYRRDNFTCQYCGSRPGSEELNIDHVNPRAQGGESTWENCVLSCMKCNTRKADRTPEQAKMKLLRLPKKPRFSLFKGEVKHVPESWKTFIPFDQLVSEAYWDVELEK
jgi:5-methylcytosine-specific restriction endonuclease McrA